MKNCPHCGGEIQDAAIKCKHCREMLGEESLQTTSKDSDSKPVYLLVAGQQKGPLEAEQLRSMWNEGTLTAETMAWQEGLPEWVPFKDIANTVGIFYTPPPQTLQDAPPADASSATETVPSQTESQPRQGAVNGLRITVTAIGAIGILLLAAVAVQKARDNKARNIPAPHATAGDQVLKRQSEEGEGLEDCTGTWVSGWGYTLVVTERTLQFMDEPPIVCNVAKKIADVGYYEVETASSKRSSFPKFLKFSLHGNNEISIEGRDELDRIDNQYSGIWFNSTTWIRAGKTKSAPTSEDGQMFGYIGKWSSARGQSLFISAKTLQLMNDGPVHYRDVTKVTNGSYYELEINPSEQNYWPNFLSIELTDNGSKIQLTGYDTQDRSGESTYSVTWFKEK